MRTPASSTASASRSASARLKANGFSSNRCLPAAAARGARSAWTSGGTANAIASHRSRAARRTSPPPRRRTAGRARSRRPRDAPTPPRGWCLVRRRGAARASRSPTVRRRRVPVRTVSAIGRQLLRQLVEPVEQPAVAPGRRAGRRRTSSPRPDHLVERRLDHARAVRRRAGAIRARRLGDDGDHVGALDDERQRQEARRPGGRRAGRCRARRRHGRPGSGRPGPKLPRRAASSARSSRVRLPSASRGLPRSTISTIRSRHSGRDSPGKPKPSGAISASWSSSDPVGGPRTSGPRFSIAEPYAGSRRPHEPDQRLVHDGDRVVAHRQPEGALAGRRVELVLEVQGRAPSGVRRAAPRAAGRARTASARSRGRRGPAARRRSGAAAGRAPRSSPAG